MFFVPFQKIALLFFFNLIFFSNSFNINLKFYIIKSSFNLMLKYSMTRRIYKNIQIETNFNKNKICQLNL